MIAAFHSRTFHLSDLLDFRGCACLVSAATPAACGDAIDVPEIVAAPLPVPLPVDTMLTPGAVMSGFR